MKADYIAIAIYIGIAFVAAAVLVFSAGLALHVGSRVKREPAVFIFLAIVVAIMAAPLATGRVLSGGLSFRDASMDEITQSFWVTRLLTLAVLAVCAERILRFIVKREWNAQCPECGINSSSAFAGLTFGHRRLCRRAPARNARRTKRGPNRVRRH